MSAIPAIPAINPENQEANDKLVRFFMKADRLAARDLAAAWVATCPDYVHAKVMWAWTLGATMDLAGSARILAEVVRERPTRYDQSSLAMALFKTGDYTASMQEWFRVLEYSDRSLHDLCHAVMATHAAGQREFARALHFADRWVHGQAVSLFCRYLLDQTHATRKAQARDALLASGAKVDPAIKFMQSLDVHHWGVIDDKGQLADLIASVFETRPAWWPETYRWPEQADQIHAALERDRSALWIFKPAALVATQGHRIGAGPLASWVSGTERRRPAIVQRYMESPRLVEGRKFNIRLQLAANAPYPDATWLWDDGLVFISTSVYSPGTMATDRAAHLVNPISGAHDRLSTPIGPYPAPGLGLQQFLALTFAAPQRQQILDAIRHVARQVVHMLERHGMFARVRSVPNWRAFPPKFFGIDLSFDDQLNPWVFELERYTGWGMGSPSTREVQTRFRRDWLPFALGADATRDRFLSLEEPD